MKQIKRNKIFFKDNWSFFIGSFTNNLPHSHYATQLSITLNSVITIVDNYNKGYKYKNFIIKSNITHRLKCKEEHLLLLFNPTSTTGHYLQKLSENEISEFSNHLAKKLKEVGSNYIIGKIDFRNTVSEISNLIETFICDCHNQSHFKDERIKTAIKYLETNYNQVILLKEIAEKCFLSESRFLHLFKENTGITFRKFQQWNKVSKSCSLLKKQSLTETAHQLGFTDSSHYSRVFKETFGFSPKCILKN